MIYPSVSDTAHNRLVILQEAVSVHSVVENDVNELESWLQNTEDNVAKLTRHIGHQTADAENALQQAMVVAISYRANNIL